MSPKQHMTPERFLQYREAFSRMKYRTEDGAYQEWIWNSRDGITPHRVLATGTTVLQTHVDWQDDIFDPFYVPLVGERVFVDLTIERARHFRRKFSRGASEEDITRLAWKDYIQFYPSTPDLVVVDVAMRHHFAARAEALKSRPDYQAFFNMMEQAEEITFREASGE